MKNELKEFAIDDLKNRNKIKEISYAKELIGKRECYFSYFIYGDEINKYLNTKGANSIAGFNDVAAADYLILDLDCKDSNGKIDLEKAIQTLKLFIKTLIEQYSLATEHILINFSGSKGFHIRIHNSLLGGFLKNNRLHLIHLEIAATLTRSFDFFDSSIYQLNRLIRIPETINNKTNQKAIFIPTYKFLKLNSMDDVYALSQEDFDLRNKEYPIINSFFDGDISFPPCEKLVELKNEVYEKIQNNQALRLIDSKNDFDLHDLLSEYPKLKLIADNCSITNDILNKAKSGTHLSNKERIFISSLLVNLHPENDNLVHSIMKNQNNYNPDITSSKYEHIKSLNYSPYNCNSMCETKLCSNAKKSKAKSPLFFANTTTKFNQSIFVEEFISYYRGQLLYDHKQEIFYFYSNGYFKKYSENQLSSLINSFLKINRTRKKLLIEM